jgi:APA family basic amino acid/polyamine antiporter
MSAVPAQAIATTQTRPRGRLLQVLGVAFGFFIVVGNTIGAGIMRNPSEVASRLPTPSAFLLAWIAGGVYAILGVASLAELGVLFPRSGGLYVFARETYGEYAGFVIGWTDWISTCASAAAMAILIGEYVGDLVGPLSGWDRMLALGATVTFALLQWRGIRWGDRTQRVTTVIKTLAFALLIIACFAWTPRAGSVVAAATALPPAAPITIAGVVLAIQAVIYTYDGWTGVLYFSGEVTNPGRDIPRGMFGGVFGVLAIYLLVNGAFLYVLGIDGLRGSDFAAGSAAKLIFGARGDAIVHAIMIVSLASSLNAVLLMASRVIYAMSCDGLFPTAARRVNVGGTPVVTLFVTVLLTLALLASGTFETVTAIAAFYFVLQYVVSFLAVFILRRRDPDAPRPYRAIGYPVTTAISLVGGVAFLVGVVVMDRRNSLWALGMLAASLPVYLVVRAARKR